MPSSVSVKSTEVVESLGRGVISPFEIVCKVHPRYQGPVFQHMGSNEEESLFSYVV